VGNSKSPFDKIYIIIDQIKKDLPSGRFAELGDNPVVLNKLEGHFEKLILALDEWKGHFSSRPLGESNPYYQAVRIAHDAQKFFGEIHNREARKENNDKIRNYMREFEELLGQLSGNKRNQPPGNGEGGVNLNIPAIPSPTNAPNLDLAPAPSNPTASIQPRQRKAWISSAIKWAFNRLGILGRLIFTLRKQPDVPEDMATLLGCLFVLVIIIGLLVLILGIFGLMPSGLIDTFKDWWRFFNPVE
jgi:hypothetical protein